MKQLNKKGQVINGLQAAIMGIGTLAIILAIVLYVLQEVQTATLTSTGLTTAASNATGSMITKVGTAPTWIGILIVVIFAAAVLSYFYFKQ